MTPPPQPTLLRIFRIAGVLFFIFGAFAPSFFLPARFNGAPALTIPQLAFCYVSMAVTFFGVALILATVRAVYRARITFRDWCWVVFAFALASCWWADHQMQQRKLDAANRMEYLRTQQSESELRK
jgi:hypothetical protein